VPDALQWQFDRAPALVTAFGWSTLTSEDLEADDLLGALALEESSSGGRALIMTGDRDMYQCATDSVGVVYLAQGKQGFDTVDPSEVRVRYGIDPAQVPDFIALRGDPSDGLPGAPGIGAKTAADLLRRHGSLEQVIAHADGERPRIATALRDHADALRAFQSIATLQPTKVELPDDRETDLAGGARAARDYTMRRLAERLERAGSLTEL
jgi:5'-3' exonuclease